MDFRTPELDQLAAEVIPSEYFQFSTNTIRNRLFKDTSMLDIKQIVHNRYRTNPNSMVDHLLKALALTGKEQLLDLGCGNGFVLENLRPHLAAGRIAGLDISPAMLRAAAIRLAGVATPCEWVEGSADDLSAFADDSFDRVMATYMMHYVPDINLCLAEVRRVLRPDGAFLLTTNRPDSMLEMFHVHYDALRSMKAPSRLFKATPKCRVSLTNGMSYVKEYFDNIDLVTWQDQLRFTEATPYMEFYRVGQKYCCAASEPDDDLDEEFFSHLHECVRQRVQEAIDHNGYFAVTKFTGTFVCS
jgi:SAM-dependent methyltransferase